MRIHRVWPDLAFPYFGVMKPEDYLATVTMHGTLMVFFVLTVAPQSGFSNLVLPEQIGARRMALPFLNALGFWLTALALLVLLIATFAPGGAPISGWTSYPPLSVFADAGPGQALGMDLWLASIGLFCIASTLGAINTLVTIVRCRCKGMTWQRMPLTVWSWFTAALLSVIVFSVLLAALLLLFCDRHYGTSFFTPANEVINGIAIQHRGDGSPLLWLHLFWFFGHPEVYIAILPGMGLTSMLFGNFCRRSIPGYSMMIATTLLIGFLGLLVWGHHMFVAGLNPFAGTAFQLTTIAIALPSTAKVINWLVICWRAKPLYRTPMLWSLGFLSFFIAGGLSGPILAQPILDSYLHNTMFVIGHFHLIMAMAAIFSIFAAISYWFPIVTGRMMSERLGKLHFWWTIFFAYNTFLPMHLTGLAGEPRHYAQLNGIAGSSGSYLLNLLPLERHISTSAIFLTLGQIFFVINLLHSLRKGDPAPPNPWDATTLEWAPQSAAEDIYCYRAPCIYSKEGSEDHRPYPQWEPEPSSE